MGLWTRSARLQRLGPENVQPWVTGPGHVDGHTQSTAGVVPGGELGQLTQGPGAPVRDHLKMDDV